MQMEIQGVASCHLVSQSVLKGGVGESRDVTCIVTCMSRDSVPQDFQLDSRGSFSLSFSSPRVHEFIVIHSCIAFSFANSI